MILISCAYDTDFVLISCAYATDFVWLRLDMTVDTEVNSVAAATPNVSVIENQVIAKYENEVNKSWIALKNVAQVRKSYLRLSIIQTLRICFREDFGKVLDGRALES